ncbi:hypothetical protein QUF72_21970 [Desulfobacterales bacterium HSG2]|nr:hypothetical protein [Desulfobacterales bacterium HSG2]
MLSNIEHQTSSIKHQASNFKHQTSNIKHRDFNFQSFILDMNLQIDYSTFLK